MNCHFVTKWLTKEWEYRPGSLWYYDFLDKTIKRQFTEKLFAKEKTNSEEIETLLNRYIETPLKGFKASITSGISKVTDWKVYRALFLYFLAQAQRYAKAQLDDNSQTQTLHPLDDLLKKDEKYLDQIIQVDMAEYSIVSVNMPPGKILFFPETGFYQMPLTDPGCITKFTMAYVVPVTPFTALAKVSKTINFEKTKVERDNFSTFSVGINDYMKRVLIPKSVKEQYKHSEIRDMMETDRKTAIDVITGVIQIRELVVKMYSMAGIHIGPRLYK